MQPPIIDRLITDFEVPKLAGANVLSLAQVSTGAPDAMKIPVTGTDGKIDPSFYDGGGSSSIVVVDHGNITAGFTIDFDTDGMYHRAVMLSGTTFNFSRVPPMAAATGFFVLQNATGAEVTPTWDAYFDFGAAGPPVIPDSTSCTILITFDNSGSIIRCVHNCAAPATVLHHRRDDLVATGGESIITTTQDIYEDTLRIHRGGLLLGMSGYTRSGARKATLGSAATTSEVISVGFWSEAPVVSASVFLSALAATGALTDADVGSPVGGSITLAGGDGTYTVDALPVSGTRPPGNGLTLVGPVYSDSSGATTTLGSYSWTDRFRSGDGQTLDVPSSVDVSVATDPYWSDVSALLHCNGMNGSPTITDEAGKTWTAYDSAVISTSQSVFGGASLLLSNVSSHVRTPSDADFSMGSGDFTIELWARYTTNGDGYKGLVVCDGIGATRGWLLYLQQVSETLGAPAFTAWVGGTPYAINLGTALTVDTWTNIVVVRDGGTLRMYINGVQQGSTAISGTVNDAAQPCVIGTLWGSGALVGGTFFSGYIDEVRVTKGVCRYPSGTTFTPQALEWPNL